MKDERQAGELLRVSTNDGKYTIVQREDGHTEALRHGEPWMNLVDVPGSKMILSIAQDLENERALSEGHARDADAWCRVSAITQSRRNLLARALRWIFKNGMHPDYDRPDHVSEAINDAWEGHRADDPWRQELGEPET